jgi:hypothetical protein
MAWSTEMVNTGQYWSILGQYWSILVNIGQYLVNTEMCLVRKIRDGMVN